MGGLIEISWLRSFAWRLGRFLYRWARRERLNDPEVNGEYWLLDQLISQQPAEVLCLMDIGANIGDWTTKALEFSRKSDGQVHVHAFEPTTSTFKHLTERFRTDQSVITNQVALSNRAGREIFYVIGSLAGRNSLHPEPGATPETVETSTFDAYLKANRIEYVNMVKSDTEGHDLSVLEGAVESLRVGKIDVWQFEYNHRWAANRATLKAVFDLIDELPYSLGKLFGNGIEFYTQWHPELDRYFETNYVLMHDDSELKTLGKSTCFDRSNVVQDIVIRKSVGTSCSISDLPGQREQASVR